MTPDPQIVAARVGALATHLLRVLVGVTVMLALGALGLFVGPGLADDWSRTALVLGGVLGGAGALVAVVVLRFSLDVAKVRGLPTVTRQDVEEAARVLASSAAAGERQVVEAKGLRKLLSLVKGLRALKTDLDALGEGGLAPAVALGKAMVPSRLLLVGLAAVASPMVLAAGVIAVLVGLRLA